VDRAQTVVMATEVIYDEAEPFQTYSPAGPQEIYCNSGEFDAIEYSNSDVDNAEMSTTAGVQPPSGRTSDVVDDRTSTSCSGTPTDGIKFLDDVVKELEARHEAPASNESASRDVPLAWNVKLRNNWKRKLRRDDAAAAAASREQKYKKSDNRQTITGSLSRSVRARVVPGFYCVPPSKWGCIAKLLTVSLPVSVAIWPPEVAKTSLRLKNLGYVVPTMKAERDRAWSLLNVDRKSYDAYHFRYRALMGNTR